MEQRAAQPLAAKTSSRDVLKLSMPLFVELLMQLMIGNVAQMALSALGSEPAAAVGNALALLNLATIALSAMATASTVLITRALGRGESLLSVKQIAMVGLLVNLCLALLLTAALLAFCFPLLDALRVDASIQSEAALFLRMLGSTTLVQAAFFACTSLLRAYARVGGVMAVSFAMNAVNLLGCALFVGEWLGFPSYGVAGAAAAGMAARVVGLLLAAWLLYRLTPVRFSLRSIRPFPWGILRQMARVGAPSAGEQMNYDVAQVVILSFVNILGTTVVAVKVYCSLLAGFAYLYSIALSQATQIVLGYLFGAGKLDAISRRVWAADLIAVSLTAVVSLTLWANAEAVLGWFLVDAAALELGRQVLLVEVLLSMGRAVNIVMVRALIALGSVRAPIAVNMASSWVVAVAGGYALGIGAGWGIVGIWVAMCADEWIRAALLVGVFARGGWRRALREAASRPLGSMEVSQRIGSTLPDEPAPS